MDVKIARKPILVLSKMTVPFHSIIITVQRPSVPKQKTLLFNQTSMAMRKMSQPRLSLLTKNRLLKIIKRKPKEMLKANSLIGRS